MKILIAYYSRTGKTEKVAEAIEREFKARGHSVEIEKVKPIKERGFWGWWHYRIIKGECAIRPAKIKNVSGYDVICVGSPNWTRLSLPIARYLQEIEGLRHKNIGFFATTILWPRIEWYSLSAYFLDLTFSRIINKKGGRIVDSILLSSTFQSRSLASEYGKKKIKNFCDKLETPIHSFKEFFLEQKEIENTRFLVILFSTLLLALAAFQIFSSIINLPVFTWKEFIYLFIILFLGYFLMLTILAGRIWFFLGKYLAGVTLVASLTIGIVFLEPNFVRSIILGYVLIFILISLSHNLRAVFLIGLFAILGYIFLFFNHLPKVILVPSLDISLIALSTVLFSFIAKNLQNHFINLLEIQDELETARAALEIRVSARTKELKELSEGLEGQIKERTKELQGKIEELERFQKLAVGRELKMIELKEKIKRLKEALENKGRKIIKD